MAIPKRSEGKTARTAVRELRIKGQVFIGVELRVELVRARNKRVIHQHQSPQIECGSKVIDAIMLIATQPAKAITAGPT